MNTAQDEAWSVSNSAVMDCKLTSPGLMFFNLLLFSKWHVTLPPVHEFFKCFGSHDREPEHESQRWAAGRRRLSFGIILEFRLPPCRRESDKLSRAHCQLSSRGAAAVFEVSVVEVVIGFKPYDNYLPAWRHRRSQRKRKKRHEHNIQHNKRGYVLEHPALRSLPACGRPPCGGHASGGGRFDAGATSGGSFRRAQPGADSGLHRPDRRPLCAPSAHGRVDLHQVPHLRPNSDGATPPLLDCRLLRTQRACRHHGLGPPSGLL